MEKFISNLDAKANYKNIKKGFRWENIPRFAVITGENGSGKTALLEQMNLICSTLESKTKYDKYIFHNTINSVIKYFDSIKLENKSYSKNDIYVMPLTNLYNIITDFRQENNIFIVAQKYFKQYHNKDISLMDFINKNYVNFNDSERNILKSYRNNITSMLKKYSNFFERHNITEEKLLLEMGQDEFYELINNINDINIESKPAIFDEQLLIDTFGNYFIKFENYKSWLEKQHQDKLVREIYEMAEKRFGKNPLDKINQILAKHYSKYELEIARIESGNIKLICREKESNALVPMSNLSLGEQIIISLIMWQYEDTTLNSVVLLLDEPDAHLNPKMAKILVDILKNAVVKEFDCQVIMTTHSLSTVAYCDDEDLFFMENGKIRKIDKKEAIEKLSDGVMTFDTAMSVVAQIQKSNKPTLMVEGKLDKLHIENFYKLSKKEIPFEIIECGGADNMSHFAIAFSQLKIPKEKILFLCDYDDKGYKAYDNVNEKYNAIYTFDIRNIDKQDDRIRLKNYPLEMLYPINILQDNNLLERISLKEYLRDIPSEQQEQKGKEFLENKCKTANKLKEDNKETFAKKIIQNLDISKDFGEIKNLIDRIEHYFKSFDSKDSTKAKPNKSHK